MSSYSMTSSSSSISSSTSSSSSFSSFSGLSSAATVSSYTSYSTASSSFSCKSTPSLAAPALVSAEALKVPQSAISSSNTLGSISRASSASSALRTSRSTPVSASNKKQSFLRRVLSPIIDDTCTQCTIDQLRTRYALAFDTFETTDVIIPLKEDATTIRITSEIVQCQRQAAALNKQQTKASKHQTIPAAASVKPHQKQQPATQHNPALSFPSAAEMFKVPTVVRSRSNENAIDVATCWQALV